MIVSRKVLRTIPDNCIYDIFICFLPGKKEIRIFSAPHVYPFAFIDPVCIHNNPASLCLSEDSCQAYHRNFPGRNHVFQHISCTYTGKLIRVSHHNQRHMLRDCLQEMIHEHNINHGAFIKNQHIPFQWLFLVFLIPLRRFVFQKPVNGLCLHSGCLRHSLCRPSGRCSQDNLTASRFVCLNNSQCGCCLSSSRSSGQYHHFR